MNKKELDIQAFIENFNKDFKTKLNIRNTQFLVNLFENFINILSSYSNNAEDLDKIVELEEKIYSSCSEEQKKQFDEWNRLQDKYFNDIEEQAFVYGYCTCKQLDIESNK